MTAADRAPPGRLGGELGQVGGAEVLPFGFLVFVVLTLLVANVWGVVDAKLAVTSAAREATRAYVESDGPATAHQVALARATSTVRAFGRDPARAVVDEPRLDRPFGRCARVAITVRYAVPVLDLPFLGGLGNLASVESTFTEVVDPFRDGLPGEAAC